MVSVSRRGQLTPPSPIRKLASLADTAKEAGRSVYHLNIGQPDIASPKEYFDGVRASKHAVVAYEPSQGASKLCEAWCHRMNVDLDLSLDPECFVITTGASEALIFAFMACCDTGDEIIVFDPTYANYLGFAAISGVSLVPAATNIENNFQAPSPAEIIKKITPRTKALLVCNPNNPTGTVYTRAEMQELLDLCEARDLFLIVDETYREFVYDGIKPFTIFELDRFEERVIVVDSLSKRYSLCGARIGALITMNGDLRHTVLKMAQARLSVATLEQDACAYMLNRISGTFVHGIVLEYASRRDVLCESFSKIPGVEVHKPSGAFYAVVGLPVKDAEHFCRFMLQDFSLKGKTTFLAPAAGFYLAPGRGKSEVRVAYVLKREDIIAAVALVGEGLEVYKGQ